MRTAAPWFAPAVAAVAALGTLLWSLPRGLDFSDEGYYLTEIAHPGDTTATALLFGWTWHPVYAMTGGSVIGLRLVSVALVALITVTLTWSVIGLRAAVSRPDLVTMVPLCAISAALAFVPLSVLPATPSYNTLAWLSLATAAVGCALAWSRRRPTLGGVLVGLAGFLAMTSKPTTAIALAIAVAITTPWRRTGARPVIAAGATLCVATATLVVIAPGHLDGLVEVVRRGVEATVGHTEFLRLDAYSFPRAVLIPLGFAGASGAVAGWLSRRHAIAGAVLGAASLALAMASLAVWHDAGIIEGIERTLPFAALTAFGLVGLTSAFLALAGRVTTTRPDAVTVRLAIFLTVLPAAYAIGTNNNMWRSAGQTVVFWFLAILLLVGTRGPLASMAAALAAYTALVAAVITPLAPYRVAPLTHTEATRVSLSGETLRLPPEEARTTKEMLAVGERLGVTREKAVLDLTGMSPGVVWAWNARPLASGWVIGGYPTSREAARVAIAPVSCGLDRALVLWAPDQRRALPADVLAPWGVRVPEDYRAVATFPRITVPATLNSPTATVETVTVLEPVDVTPQNCKES